MQKSYSQVVKFSPRPSSLIEFLNLNNTKLTGIAERPGSFYKIKPYCGATAISEQSFSSNTQQHLLLCKSS